jgi:hypothetical protein
MKLDKAQRGQSLSPSFNLAAEGAGVAVFPAAGYTLTLRKSEAALGIKAADAEGDDLFPVITAVIPGGALRCVHTHASPHPHAQHVTPRCAHIATHWLHLLRCSVQLLQFISACNLTLVSDSAASRHRATLGVHHCKPTAPAARGSPASCTPHSPSRVR